MKGLRYDLHLHSCLSPCGDAEMTPASIAGMARICGAQIIALSDHNSAENLPAVEKACQQHGILLLPAIELNTAEEIHLLGYFPTVEAALDMGREIYRRLPQIPCREEIFGSQVIMDSEDHEIGRVEKLLISAADLSLERAVQEIAARGGVAVPAHVDRDSYSALSVLGILPEEPRFAAVELRDMARREALEESGRLPRNMELLTSSDAHYLWDMREKEELSCIGEDSVLWPLIRTLPGVETCLRES